MLLYLAIKCPSPPSLLSGDYILALAYGALYDSALTEEVSTAQIRGW